MANSFDEVLDKEAGRFVNYAFEEDGNIHDFGSFKLALSRKFDTPNGNNASFSEQNIIDLFESKECKERMKENVSPQEFEQLFGDGIVVHREAISNKRMIILSGKKINVKSYKTRKGQVKRASVRLEARKWSGVELKFIRARKVKGIKPSKIFVDYNKHFSSSPRSKSSLKTRFYRL
jgi:hypothetical protein